jgi:hypothetical protein
MSTPGLDPWIVARINAFLSRIPQLRRGWQARTGNDDVK